jgi:hypothetical protein
LKLKEELEQAKSKENENNQIILKLQSDIESFKVLYLF